MQLAHTTRLMHPYHIRPLTAEDIPRLTDIRAGFVSETVLKIQKTGDGLSVGWQLNEIPLAEPFDKQSGYDFDEDEQANILNRLENENCLIEIATEPHHGRIVGILDVTEQAWNNVAFVWNIMLDKDVRGKGLGHTWIQHTKDWARQHGLRAIMLETQTNNVPACKFYARMGFQLVGLNDALYTNHDIKNDEVALFWSYPLES